MWFAHAKVVIAVLRTLWCRTTSCVRLSTISEVPLGELCQASCITTFVICSAASGIHK
jgi:hypothetical protein